MHEEEKVKDQTSDRPNRRARRMKARMLIPLTLVLTGTSFLVSAQRQTTHAVVCGNPQVRCKTTATFQPNDLPFQVARNAVIVDTVPFYAIILKSMAVKNDDCAVFIPEGDRLAAQALFPDHKVFSSRCTDPENLFYADVSSRNTRYFSETHRILAIYAGSKMAEARTMLATVQATGKYPGANIRRMRTGFNGT
jgi:hypothetical protein